MSTEFRIGMSEGRNSSRVLKPPGGGHSQIFGGPDEEAPRKNHQKTAISSCFATETPEVAKAEEKVDTQEKEVKENEENTMNGNNAENGTNGAATEEAVNKEAEEKKNEINQAKTATPERKRVPPGGFSSGGFW